MAIKTNIFGNNRVMLTIYKKETGEKVFSNELEVDGLGEINLEGLQLDPKVEYTATIQAIEKTVKIEALKMKRGY